MKLEELIEEAYPDLREITFHSDGRVIAKTGGKAKNPKRLYNGRKGGTLSERTKSAIIKLIENNK